MAVELESLWLCRLIVPSCSEGCRDRLDRGWFRMHYNSSSIFLDQRSEATGFFGESLSFFTLGLVGGFSGLDASGIRPLLGRTGLGPAGSWPCPMTAPSGSRRIPFS